MNTLRITKQRKTMLDEMKKLTFHPTTDEFYAIIKQKLPEMSLCTVYRNLEKFHTLGLIEKIKGNPVRYEANPKPHNHIVCIHCGKVEDLLVPVQIDMKAITEMGYKLHAYNLEMNGICPQCQKSNQEEIHVETKRLKN